MDANALQIAKNCVVEQHNLVLVPIHQEQEEICF